MGLCTLHPFSLKMKILVARRWKSQISLRIPQCIWSSGKCALGQLVGCKRKGSKVHLDGEGVKELICLPSPSLCPKVHGAGKDLKVILHVLVRP